MVEAIPLKDLQIGRTYLLKARNLKTGVWDGTRFMGHYFKFSAVIEGWEYHWDSEVRGTPGSALPLKVIS